jgi:hypothetical protein
MSTPAFTSIDAFRASSALLRKRSAAGCPIASAEVSRRAINGKGGHVRECLRQGIKPAAKSGSQPAQQRDTLKAVRSEFDARLTRMEGTLVDVTAAIGKTHEAVALLSRQVSSRMAA